MALTTHASIYEHVILSSQQSNCAPLKPLPPNSLSQLGPFSTSRMAQALLLLCCPVPPTTACQTLSEPSYMPGLYMFNWTKLFTDNTSLHSENTWETARVCLTLKGYLLNK